MLVFHRLTGATRVPTARNKKLKSGALHTTQRITAAITDLSVGYKAAGSQSVMFVSAI